eukprot:COSAG02_NODE_3574_length_6538_cov_261.862137_5_plen_142_part_00
MIWFFENSSDKARFSKIDSKSIRKSFYLNLLVKSENLRLWPYALLVYPAWLEQVVFNAYRRDGPPSSPHWDDGFIEQIWYDDWETIGVKVKMARDKYQLGGVGLYQSTGGYPDGEDCDGCMWPVYQSIRVNFVENGTSTAA